MSHTSQLIIFDEPVPHALGLYALQLICSILGVVYGHDLYLLVIAFVLHLLLHLLFFHYRHRAAVQGLEVGELFQHLVPEYYVLLLALEKRVNRIFERGQVLQAAKPIECFVEKEHEISKVVLVGREGLQHFEDGEIGEHSEFIIIDDQGD